jgi:hypothetical protein
MYASFKVESLEREVKERNLQLASLNGVITELQQEKRVLAAELKALREKPSPTSAPLSPPSTTTTFSTATSLSTSNDSVTRASTQPLSSTGPDHRPSVAARPLPPPKQRLESRRETKPSRITINKKKSRVKLDKEIVSIDDANAEIERLRELRM